MKKFFLFCFLKFAVSNSNAQILKSIGIKGGESISTQNAFIEFAFDKKVKKLQGIYVAISTEFLNTKFFSVETDIGYCEKGSIIDLNLDLYEPPSTRIYTNYTLRNRLSYLQVNPNIKFHIEYEQFILYAFYGFRMDYLVAQNGNFSYPFNILFDQNIKKEIYGITIGAGIEYKMNKIGIHIGFQNQHDFTYAAEKKERFVPNENGFAIKNKARIINIGIRYYFLKKEIL